MVVIFAIFDAKIGPTILHSIPRNIESGILDKILILMNQYTEDNEVLVNDLKSIGMKAFTLHINIPSPWARGGKEYAQISALTRIEDAPSKKIEASILDFKKILLNREDVYKALYFNSFPDKEFKPTPVQQEILIEHEFMINACHDLYQGIAAGLPSTSGWIAYTDEIAKGNFPVPQWLVEIMKDKGESSKVFMVFRKDSDESITIKIIPIKHDALKVKVKMKQIMPDQIMKIGAAIKLKLLSSSGICRESSKDCFWEGYFEYEIDFQMISGNVREKVSSLDFVENVKITKVSRL